MVQQKQTLNWKLTRHKSSFPVDTFCILTTISKLSAGALTFSLEHVPMLNNVGTKALPMSKPVRVRVSTQRPEKAQCAAQVLLDLFCGLSWGNCCRCTELSWLAVQEDFPKRDFTGKGCKILSDNIPVTISQPSIAGQVCCSGLKLGGERDRLVSWAWKKIYKSNVL